MKTMDHRIAERRHQVSEDKARSRLRWLVWIVVGVVVVAMAIWLVNSPLLSIRTVTVAGAEHSNPAAIAADLGVEPGTPTLSVRGGSIEQALANDPWIASAEVTVSWPGSVDIDVIERVPVASIVTDNGVFLVGEDTVLMERAGETPEPPIITTDSVGVTRVGNSVGHRATAAAVAFVAALTPELRRTTLVTVVGDTVDAEVDGVFIVIGRPKDMAAKASAINALIATGIEPGSRIDVTAPTRPAVAPPQSQVEGETKTLEESQPSD
jgi:cell division protein FtsQ